VAPGANVGGPEYTVVVGANVLVVVVVGAAVDVVAVVDVTVVSFVDDVSFEQAASATARTRVAATVGRVRRGMRRVTETVSQTHLMGLWSVGR
jgi:hypothetical protein